MILKGLYGVWIIGYVAWLIAFMSVFFSSQKTVFKSLLDTSLTPGGSIEKVLVSSIASRQLGRTIELLFLIWWFLPQHLLDTFIYRQPFYTYLDNFLDTSRHLHLLRFINGLYILLVRSAAHFCRSFSWYLYFFISQTFLTHSNLLPQGFFKLFQDFLHLVKLLFSHINAFHVLKPRIWDFWKILGFFKIVEFLLKFWDGF